MAHRKSWGALLLVAFMAACSGGSSGSDDDASISVDADDDVAETIDDAATVDDANVDSSDDGGPLDTSTVDSAPSIETSITDSGTEAFDATPSDALDAPVVDSTIVMADTSDASDARDASDVLDAMDDTRAAADSTMDSGRDAADSESLDARAIDSGVDTAIDVCAKESDVDFCARVGRSCGPASGTDNCGLPRSIASCGGCADFHLCVAAGSGSACVVEPRPPRFIGPLSTSIATSQRPRLTFVLGLDSDAARIDVCRDRACAKIVTTLTGTSSVTPSALTPGVYFWRAVGMRGALVGTHVSPTWQFSVGARSAPIDTSWASTPDVNGDGLADALVGAQLTPSCGGSIYVYLNHASGSPTLQTLPGPYGSGCTGDVADALASAGDVHGDGFADVIAGSREHAVHLYFGSATGVDVGASQVFTDPEPPTLSYETRAFGAAVASLGDVDGDGYADVAVAAPSGYTARIYVFTGGPHGLAATRHVTLAAGDKAKAGPLAGADFNGDGYGDLAVGDPGAFGAPGRVVLFFGGAGGIATSGVVLASPVASGRRNFATTIASAADVDADGYGDLLVSEIGGTDIAPIHYVHLFSGGPSGLKATPRNTFSGDDSYAPGVQFHGVGDVNGDGFGDVVIPFYVKGISYTPSELEAHVALYLGSASGLAGAAVSTTDSPDGVNCQFGYAIADVGDMNGDALADFIVSAPNTDVTGMAPPKGIERTGRLHLFLGRTSGFGTRSSSIDPPNSSDRNFGYSLGAFQ